MKKILKKSAPAIAKILMVIGFFTILQSSVVAQIKVLDNAKLRFGTGSESSVNNTGNLQQPFYYNSVQALWRKLTFSNYSLDNSFAIGGIKTNEWNLNGTVVQNPVLTGQTIDLSGYVATSANTGYGTIVSTGTITISGQLLEVRNTYTLPQNNAYITVTTRLRNISAALMENVRIWIGTRDDWVGDTDSPRKQKGNLVNGAFTQITNTATRAAAVQITSGSEGVLFYTNSTRGNTVVNNCCSFTNVTNQDPNTSTFDVTNDGSYAFFVRMNDLAVGDVDEFTWYYAAGELANLNTIINEVAVAGSISNITYTSATLTAKTPVASTGYWMVVPSGSATPTPAQIKTGANYGAVSVVSSGSGAMAANVDATFNLNGLSANTQYVVHFVSQSVALVYSSQIAVPFTTQAYTVPTVSTTVISGVTAVTASSGGNVTNNGGQNVTARGVCWSTSPSPTIANSKTIDGTGNGTFSSTLIGLSSSTTYYARAYATNATGTSYGNEVSFTTNTQTPAGALDFQGTDDYVDLGSPLASNASYTREGWIFNGNPSFPNNNLFSTAGDPVYIPGGTLSVAQGGQYGVLTDPNPFPVSTWTHVAITYDKPTNTIKLYVNGVLKATNTNAPAFAGGTTYLGKHPSGGGQSSVRMDEVRFWSRALSSCEINANMNCELPNPTTQNGLVRYYKFNQGFINADNTSITSITDASVNNVSGTLVGFTKTGTTSNFIAGTISGTCAAYVIPTAAITGTTTLCMGTGTTLANTLTGGTWSSSNLSVATINTTSGVVSTVSAGTTTITYTNTCGGVSTATFTVKALPNVDAVSNQEVCHNGVATTAIVFSGAVSGTVYNWTNNTPSIGLAANGTGNIASFVGQNSGTSPVTATITVTPSYNGCTGSPITFTIRVNPIPTFNAIANQTVCAGASAGNITFVGQVSGTTYQWSGGAAIGLANGNGATLPSFTTINPGTTPVTANILVISNVQGAMGSCGTSRLFTITVNPLPVASISAAGPTSVCPGNTVTLQANSGSGFSYQWQQNGVAIPGANGANYVATTSGNYAVVITNNGCESLASNIITLSVQDVIPPYIVTPATIITPVNNAGAVVATSAAGAVVEYTLPVGADNCTSSPSVTAVPASGSVFPIGNTTVTVTVTDNEGLTATSSFVVTVAGTLPVINCPANITVNNTTGQCGAIVNFAATETTGIPASVITYSVQPGTFFNIGTHTVTATATNALGTVTCTFTIQVVDAELPILTVPSNITVNNTAGTCGAVVTYAAPTATDNCYTVVTGSQNFSYSGNIVNFTVPAGVTSITIDAKGAQGGSGAIYGTSLAGGGGKGARMQGTVSVTPGEVIRVLVGQMGGSSGGPHGNENGGGGGSFVVRQSGNVPLVVAGGGGGAPSSSYGLSCTRIAANADGQIGTSGVSINCYTSASGGANGNGGSSAGSYQGGAGGGFYSNGANGGTHCSTAIGGASFLNGGTGGTGNNCYNINNYGGFGGGGGGQLGGPGGGGGYSGGASAGAWSSNSTYGGGGGSYNIGTSQANTAGANVGNGSVTISWNGNSTPPVVQTAGLPSGATYPVGTTTNTFVSTDAAGNTSTQSFTVTVVDNQNPTITCPSNISVGATSTLGAVVNYTAPVGTDNCSGATTTRIAGPASGSTFPIGTTTVTHRVTDAAGNTTTCSFTVTVVSALPVINCPANITVGNTSGLCGANVNFTATETTGVPASIITSSVQPGTFFNIGTHTVTATATNIFGSSSCSFTVTVVDNQAPIVVCQNITIPLDATGNAVITAAQINNGSSDNCGIASITINKTNFDCTNILTTATTNFKVFTSTGSFVVPNGATNVRVLAIGGGGGGANGHQGGGGSGYVQTATLAVTPGQTIPVTVGVGGSGATLQPNNNIIGLTPGLASSFGSLLTANGGGVVSGVNARGGAGGSGGGGSCNSGPLGGSGGAGGNNGNACSYLGGIGQGNYVPSLSLFTANSISAGAGGAGGTSSHSGGGGAGGILINNAGINAGDGSQSFSGKGGKGYGAAGGGGGYESSLGANRWAGGNGASGLVYVEWESPAGNPVTLTVTDIHGNTATCTALVTVVDNIAPTFSSFPADITVNATSAAGAVVTYSTPVAADNCSATAAKTAGLASGATFPIGTSTVTYTATDLSGNTFVRSFTVTVSGLMPSIVCPANITVNNASGQCGANVSFAATETTGIPASVITYSVAPGSYFNIGTTTVTATATNAVGTSSCTFTVTVVDNVAPVFTIFPTNTTLYATSAAGATVTYDIPEAADNCSVTVAQTAGLASGATFPIGTNTVTYTATDPSGNTFARSFTVTVAGLMPSIVCPANITVNNTTGQCGANVSFAASETTGIPASVITYSVAPGSFFTVGTTTVTATATNAVGTSVCTFTVTVVDNENPTITAPANVVTSTDLNSNTASNVALGTPVTFDNCAVSSVTNNAPAVFPIGTTIVTWTVTDPAAQTATATQQVTVADNQAPTVITQNITVQLDANGSASITAAQINNGSTDNTTIATYSVNNTNFSCANLGNNTVVLSVTDIYGNTGTATAIVTVVDMINPIIVCAGPQVIDLSANCNATLPDYRNLLTVSDNCTTPGALIITQSPAAGTTITGTGTITVNFTVTDASGNVSTCSITVTKRDVTAPVIVCPQPVVVNNDPNVCGAVVNYGASSLLASSSTGLNAGSLFSVNTTTGVATLIGANGLGLGSNRLTSLAKDPATGILYGVLGGSANLGGYLIRINTTTGAGTLVGLISGPGFNGTPGIGGADALAFAPNGDLYSSGWNGGTSGGGWFLKLNKATGAVTQSFFVSAEYTGLAFSPTTGVLYASRGGNSPGRIHTINPANGAILTNINLFDGSARITDLAFSANGTLYAPMGGSLNNLITINTTNGAITTIGGFGSAVQNIAGMTFAGSSNGPVQATDNCSSSVTVVQTAGLPSGSVFPIGTTINTFVATDASGNSSTCSFAVTVTDNQKPSIVTVNKTQTNDAGDCGAVVSVPVPVTADNCAVATLVNDYNGTADASGHYPVGTRTIVWTVTDINGNAQTATQTVTVTDNEKPTITAPGAYSVVNNAGQCGATIANIGTPVTADNCGVASVTNDHPSNFYPVGTTIVTWTVTDIHGNVTDTAKQSIVVMDNELPTIVVTNVSVSSDVNQCGATVLLAAPVTTDNCGVATVTNDHPSANFPVGTTTVTWTVTDIHGLHASTVQTVTVTDVQAPTVITQNITVNLDANGAVSITPSQINNGSFDNCAIATISLDKTSFNCANVGANTVILTVTDVNGNVSTQTAVVTVVDNIAPTVITQNITVNLDANGAVSITPSQINNGSFDNCAIATYSLDKTSFNCSNVGANTVILTVTDVNGNVSTSPATVTVVDNIAPTVITQNITVNLDANGAVSITPSQINNGSFDNCAIASYSLDKTSFNCANVGANTVILTVTDVNGNVSTSPATVTVVDNIAPTVITQNITVNLDANGAVSITPSQINNGSFDNCSIATITLDKTSFNCSNVGANTVILTVTDVNGNVSTSPATVTVVDNIAPTVITQNITVNLDANGTVSITPSQINNGSFDNCSIATITLDKTSFNCSNVGANTVILTVTDVNGNVSTSPATVTVVDNIAPTVITQNITVNLDANGAVSITPSQINNGSFDNCSIATITLDKTSFNCANVGANTVILTVTDVNGNVSTSPATVTVVDNIAPTVITQNITVNLDANGAVSITPSQINNGSFDNCSIATITLNKTSFNCANVGANTVILTVTDVNGNVSTSPATVTVVDNIAPIVTPPSAQTFCANANGSNVYTIPVASATDNCTIATITYSVTGATTRTGSGYNASGAFAIGTSNITWTITDVNGNITQRSTTVVINPLPVATYVSSNADAFCNGVTLTGSSSINAATYSWSNTNAAASFNNSSLLNLGLSNADGNYYLYVKATATGCVSATSAVYNYQKQTLSSSYTILAYKEVELGKYNKVVTGSVGVMTSKGEAEFKSYTSVNGVGAFVKAPRIDKDGSGILIPNQIIGIATVTLPAMQLNTSSTHNLPSFTASVNNATLSGNYKNLTIKKGISVTLTNNTFGSIRLEEGASVRFTNSILNIESLTADKGARNNDYSYVRFAPNTSVRVSSKVSFGSQVLVNPEANKVTFYMGDNRKDEEKFTVKGGDTRVIANVFMPDGKLRVTATDSDDDDRGNCDHRAHDYRSCRHRGHEHNDCDHRSHQASSCNDDVYMTGLFIAEEVESKGNTVIWNSFNCSAPAPVQPIVNKTGTTQTVTEEKTEVKASTEEELKVTVMPNPSTTYFTLKLESKYETPVSLRVMDGSGRVVDAKSKIGSNSTFQIGHNYSSGTYYAELIQGTKRKVVQLIKARG